MIYGDLDYLLQNKFTEEELISRTYLGVLKIKSEDKQDGKLVIQLSTFFLIFLYFSSRYNKKNIY